jgi:NADP-dependent 3-hydroxy acid dehydrogenase YdfG
VHLILADRDAGRLGEACAQLGKGRAAAFACDVADGAEVEALRDFALARHGRVDLVFNNAGVVLPFRPMWEYAQSDWDWLMGVNLRGVIHGIRAFVPHMVARGSGHVINTASMAGVGVIPRNGPYNAAKHAVVSLTETLAAELAEVAPDVRASVLCPGLVPTRIHESPTSRPDAESFAQNLAAARPRQSQAVTAEAVARLTLQAVEENRTYIFTNPGSAAFVRQRFAQLLRDAND